MRTAYVTSGLDVASVSQVFTRDCAVWCGACAIMRGTAIPSMDTDSMQLPLRPIPLFAALFAALALGACSRTPPPPAENAVPVDTVRAVQKSVPELINAVGTVEAINSVAIKSLVEGQLLE